MQNPGVLHVHFSIVRTQKQEKSGNERSILFLGVIDINLMRNYKALKRTEIIAALRAIEVGGVSAKYCGPYLFQMQDALTDAADLIEQLTTELPNDPLTLEELRGTDGEPVWVEWLNGDIPWGTYSIVWLSMRSATNGYVRFPFKKYGKTWLAYRRKPDGGGGVMNGCNNCAKRRDVQKECPWGGTYHHRGEHGERIGTCNAYRKETNADRIRSMNDEELAEVLEVVLDSQYGKCYNCDGEDCRACWLNWLQQPAPEVADEADS